MIRSEHTQGPPIVIVIDDDAANRQLLVTLMNYQGHRVLEARDGREGLELVRSTHPQLVISDILMPTMDGYEFVRQLRTDAVFSDVEVIFYTAHYHEREARALAEQCEVARVLTKPCEPAEILNAVAEVLGGTASPAPRVHVDEAFDRDHLRLVTNKLAEKADELHAANGRLKALTELNLQLASERNLHTLLEKVCCGARGLLGTKLAVLAVTEKYDGDAMFSATSGIENATCLPCVPNPRDDAGPLGLVYARRAAWRTHELENCDVDGVLPSGFPRATAFLAVPICSLAKVYGWLCVADKMGAEGFSAEDENLLLILAAQAGRIYENGSLHLEVQLHAAQLQVEIDERKLADDKIRKLNRVYAVLSGINSLVVRVSTQDELFTETCRLAVKHGGFPVAWIGAVDTDLGEIAPIACAGGVPYIPDAMLARKALAFGRDSFLAAAVISHQPQICNDLPSADDGVPFRTDMIGSGCRSLVTLPLTHQGVTVACLILAAEHQDSFDGAEMRLLSELADDISFALDHIDKAARLKHIAYYDELTGFANRTLFLERLAQSISAAGWSESQFLVVIADLERFDSINDTYGRKKGDTLLKEIADRFRLCIGDPSAVARVAPEHFAAMIPFSGEAEIIISAFEHKYQAWLGAPFAIDGSELRVSARAGIALFPHDGHDAESLLKNAEAALKRAKTSGDKFVFFTKEISDRVAERVALETHLRRALANGELDLHYQPKVDLETRAIVGVEALMRWQNPVLGAVPPGTFIGIMEETGMIVETGAWALHRAAENHAAWVKSGFNAPRVAVNVSSVQVRTPDFVAMLVAAIATEEKPGRHTLVGRAGIDIEVTESLLLEHADANVEKLKEIRRIGVNIAIDDFGTGYSSLSYLARLPLDCLKIDRSFIAAMLDDPSIMTLVSTMITLAHSMKLKVIAEGVELEEQAKILRLLRCDQMQGYLVSRPVSFDAMTQLLERAQDAGSPSI